MLRYTNVDEKIFSTAISFPRATRGQWFDEQEVEIFRKYDTAVTR